ncbi:ABC transporter family substrate-binding protein [Nonomuraea sp. NPDC050790]|uniref:ABC transporter family substrate-binding protein n=1 Tax=Nonomuraea sp. NPDC050790 TaxID=3364371 RepID=UPI0037A4F828
MSRTLIVLLLLLTGCAATPPARGSGGTVTVATIQQWSGFNPHVPSQGEAIGLAIGNLIYPSPFVVGPDLSPALNTDLLLGAEVTDKDPLTVVYTIKPEAVWSDGAPISADDFVYLWRHMSGRVKDAQVTSALGYESITSVTGSESGKKVTVVLDRPFGEWQSLFARLLPAHFLAKQGAEPKSWNEGLISATPPTAGPFTVSGHQRGQTLTFSRNAAWKGSRAQADTVVLRYVKDPQAVVQAMASGEVDIATLDPDQSALTQLKALPSVRAELVPTTTVQFLAFQFGRAPASELPVRKAVALALDVKTVTAKTLGAEGRSFQSVHHLYPAGSPGYTDNLGGRYGAGDAEAARAVLEKAGYERGADGYYRKAGKPLVLRHALSSGGVTEQQIAVLLQDMLASAGIKLDIVTSPDSTYFERVLIPGDYDTLAFGYPGSAFPVSWSEALYTCEGGYNFQRFCDPAVDELFAAATGAVDEPARQAAADTIDKELWARLSLFPLFTVPDVVAHSTRIAGYRPHPLMEWRLAAAGSWSRQS